MFVGGRWRGGRGLLQRRFLFMPFTCNDSTRFELARHPSTAKGQAASASLAPAVVWRRADS